MTSPVGSPPTSPNFLPQLPPAAPRLQPTSPPPDHQLDTMPDFSLEDDWDGEAPESRSGGAAPAA